MLLFFILIGLPFLGWFIGVSIYDAILGATKKKDDTITIHNHYYYDNRSVTIQQEENHHLD